MNYFFNITKCALIFVATQTIANPLSEVLDLCGKVAKDAAVLRLMDEEPASTVTQRTIWLSGYEPKEQISPIFMVLIDFVKLNKESDYVGYKVTTTYNNQRCEMLKIEKEPL
jgi:hypothetical protein